MTDSPCHYIWQNSAVTARYQTAVSIHSHTQQSRELLDFIPRYSRNIPVLCQAVQAQQDKYRRIHGKELDFRTAWWTPPLPPREAYDLERKQIENTLGLKALVSLSDHDDIEAALHLRVLSDLRDVPISVEWTVPFGPTFFHLGVHNLPPDQAQSTMAVLSDYTEHPDEAKLAGVLEMLNGYPSTLLVLNHPLWDEICIGEAAHRATLKRFTALFGKYLHAAELNGLRYYQENAGVMKYAAEVGLPVISGGDRHGCEPNANVNLTNASTFEDFVDEVRNGRQSTVLFLSQYREPVRLRLLQGLVDVVREYPEFAEGRRKWTNRVFFQKDDGQIRTLSSLWADGGPRVVRWFMAGVRLLESRRVRVALRFALAERQEGVI
ncbi:MAG: hypothetical protein SGI92_29035 [Bryobacteraceae bacterium]|nr:hypothetical protein [Bryobacteraceae bacterium]